MRASRPAARLSPRSASPLTTGAASKSLPAGFSSGLPTATTTRGTAGSASGPTTSQRRQGLGRGRGRALVRDENDSPFEGAGAIAEVISLFSQNYVLN